LPVFLTLCLGVVEWPGVRGADGDVKKSEPGTDAADEALLKTAGLTGDGQALLDFFRQRTVQRVDPAKIKSLINQLDDESFQVREQASAELVKYRKFAEQPLSEALKNSDNPEVLRRARRCLERIRSIDEANLESAVARKIAAKQPAGSAEVLLAYIPSVVDPMVLDEVQAGLAAIATKDGRALRTIADALGDNVALKRAAAGIALVKAGGSDGRTRARGLLNDNEDEVRFRVGMALAIAKDKQAVPVLIELLLKLPEEQGRDVEDILIRLADDKPPPQLFGIDKAKRRAAREFWAGWWAKEGNKIDIASKKLDIPPIERTIGMWVNADKKTGGITRALIERNGNGLRIETWGACGGLNAPVESLLGKVALDRRGKADWNHGFKLTHSKVSIERGDLVMEEFNEFKDGTNRDYKARYTFKRVNALADFKDPRRQ
jgi:HEAT repeat protein